MFYSINQKNISFFKVVISKTSLLKIKGKTRITVHDGQAAKSILIEVKSNEADSFKNACEVIDTWKVDKRYFRQVSQSEFETLKSKQTEINTFTGIFLCSVLKKLFFFIFLRVGFTSYFIDDREYFILHIYLY